MLKWYCD